MSFIFGGDTGTTYEDVQRKRKMADAILAGQMRRSPRDVGEGLTAIGNALLYRSLDKKASAGMDRLNKEADDLWSSVFGGGGTGGTPGFVSSQGGTGSSSNPLGLDMGSTVATPRNTETVNGTEYDMGSPDMVPYRNAIASIESAGSGDYAAVGPTHPKLGRALGKYQIMEANIGPWSREVLGQEITPEQFMADPKLQDAIFDGKFGSYVQQYGPEGAAQAWFAGPGGVGKMDRRDVLGTTVADYTAKFTGAMGGNPGTVSTQGRVGQGGGMNATVQQLMQLASNPVIMNDPAKAMVVQSLLGQALKPPAPRDTQFVKGVGLIDLQTGEIVNDYGGNVPGGGDQTEYGLTPQYGVREDGTLTMIQLAKDGTAKEVELPEGIAIRRGLEKLDLGQSFQWYNTITGEPVGAPIPKDADPAAGAKKQRQQDLADTSSETVVNSATRALQAAQNRIVGGAAGAVAAFNPSSENAEVYRQVRALQSMAASENINAMRQASPTGGALGNASDADILLLKEKSGALDPASPYFERDLRDYTRTLLETIHGRERGREIFDASFPAEAPPPGGASPAPQSSAPGANEFANMGMAEIGQVDINSLTPEQMDALEARMKELGL